MICEFCGYESTSGTAFFIHYCDCLGGGMGPLSLGTKTPYGKIEAVGARDGERYYMCLKDGVVSLIPGPALEAGMHFCQKIDDELVEKYNREVGDAK